MNNLGRHYRDPSHPEAPECNYESGGVRCTFFSEDNELASIPYPTDVTFGPVSEHPVSSSSDLSTILALLNEQKAQAEIQQRETAQQFRSLQEQVNVLSRGTQLSVSSAPTNYTSSTPETTSSMTTTTTVTYSRPLISVRPAAPDAPNPVISTQNPVFSAPTVVQNAAANLNAALQAGLGRESQNPPGLTIGDLRSNPAIMSQAAALLANATQNVPPLNPLEGLSQHQQRSGQNQVNSVDQLFRATTVNKQLRAYEFAATGQFHYKNQLKIDNVNAVTFAYGAFKHLDAIKSGLLGNVSEAEFLARIRHLRNVFEIACLSSSLNSFSDPAWTIAREYDNRVMSDIESGAKNWNSLSNSIEPDAIYCAKETVDNRNRLNKVKKNVPTNPMKKEGEKSKKVCTTFNTHRSSEGCYFEQQNEGKTCVYEHSCSWCKANRNAVEKHKAINCEFKTE